MAVGIAEESFGIRVITIWDLGVLGKCLGMVWKLLVICLGNDLGNVRELLGSCLGVVWELLETCLDLFANGCGTRFGIVCDVFGNSLGTLTFVRELFGSCLGFAMEIVGTLFGNCLGMSS